MQTLFEAVSAFGTVGATHRHHARPDRSGTDDHGVAMFVGRLGPLTLVLALAARARPVPYRPAIETIRIG